MTNYEPAAFESAANDDDGTEIQERDVRALIECMSVLPEGGDVYTVVGQNGGGEYRVDARESRCTCPDFEYNLPTDDGRERCKHIARVEFATGERGIPNDVDGVDEQLGAHVEAEAVRQTETVVDATPQVATDGGAILDEEGEDGDVVNRSDGNYDSRPDNCDCSPISETLPCWPCARAGFETPNPNDEEGE